MEMSNSDLVAFSRLKKVTHFSAKENCKDCNLKRLVIDKAVLHNFRFIFPHQTASPVSKHNIYLRFLLLRDVISL